MTEFLASQIANSRLHNNPIPHLHIDTPRGDTDDIARLEALVAEYPEEHLVKSERLAGSDKSYSVSTLTVHLDGEHTSSINVLSPRWQALVDAVSRPQFVQSVADRLKVSEPIDGLEVRLASYRSGGWMSRHTDGPDKLFSAIFYFNPSWIPQWGGQVSFFQDEEVAEASCVAFPGNLNGVAFARSDVSWHEVSPVEVGASEPRRTLLLHGYRK